MIGSTAAELSFLTKRYQEGKPLSYNLLNIIFSQLFSSRGELILSFYNITEKINYDYFKEATAILTDAFSYCQDSLYVEKFSEKKIPVFRFLFNMSQGYISDINDKSSHITFLNLIFQQPCMDESCSKKGSFKSKDRKDFILFLQQYTEFLKFGDPANKWPSYKPNNSIYIQNEQPIVANKYKEDICHFWSEISFPSNILNIRYQ